MAAIIKIIKFFMINIIREDLSINPDLGRFPSANANIAIFGTQSSGKSTLLNHVFGTKFPVLDTSVTRERCTKGVWVHNIGNFNVIDTEGFDSSERDVHEKIFEKQIALFCLALSDVLIINMWMTEIGRYEASHSHILKAVIRASDRLIAKQQRKIIFVVRDCTEDAERSILRDELNSQMMGIVKAETKKSNMRFTLEYFMMSHYYENQKDFKSEAKDLLRIISTTRKSNLSNYTEEDRMVYVKNLWSKVTTDTQIDLRTAEDALRNYALERIKRETVDFMENWLDCLENLEKLKTYTRFKEAAARQTRLFFMEQKPKHLKQNEIEPYIEAILQVLDSRQNKYFMTVLLPNEEDRLIEEEYKKKIDVMMGENVVYFKRNIERRREEMEDTYRVIVRGLREHAKMTRRFIEKIEAANSHYEQYLQHLHNVFKMQLQNFLNEEVDRQTRELDFDGARIRKVIDIAEEKHKAEAQMNLHEIWDRVVVRTSNSTIVDRIKAEGQQFSTAGFGAFMGSQTEIIISHYRKLQDKAQKYLQNLMNFLSEEEETTATLERVENIRKLINNLIDAKIVEEAKRFKITLVFVAFLMFFFFSEFKFFLKIMGMGKRRMRNWVWLYSLTIATIFGVLIFRKRDYLKKFIEPLQ